MNRFKNILVVDPADGTDLGAAMERAVDLALRDKAALTLTSTVEEVPKRRSRRAERQGIDIEAILVDDRRRGLNEVADTYRHHRINIDVSLDVGVSVVETVRRVIRENHDLVVTPDDAGPTGFRSRTKQLLRRCPSPLWVVRPSRSERLKVLAAVDPLTEGDEASLSGLVMELATSLTVVEEGELHIIHAWSMDGETTLRSSPYVSISPVEVDHMVDFARDEHRDALDDLVDQFDLSSVQHEVHLLKGDPRRLIPALAVEKEINLIVMGTVARSGVAGLVIGNTAETVLDSLDCSVLAVKPQGFVVPGTQAAGPVS